MKITLICHYYPPEIGAPQARLSEHAREWIHQGHDVHVLTGLPNHPTGVIPDEYKGIWKRKEQGQWGETIIRHWLYATPNKGFVKKIIGHISFMFTVLLSLFDRKPDIYIVSSPTFFSVMSTWLMSRLRGVPYFFEVRDLWPGIFIELGVLKNRILIRFLEAIEIFLYKQAEKVVVVTDGFKEDLIKRGIKPEKIEVITNGVWVDQFDEELHRKSAKSIRKELNLEDKFVSLYIGAHGISQALDVVIRAAKELKEAKEFFFLFVGEGAEKEKLQKLTNEYGLDNVLFHPGVPRQQALAFYHACDTSIISLRNIEGFKSFIPSKMFEIMASKKPFVACVKGESENILNRSSGGKVVPPEDSLALTAALKELKEQKDLARFGENGFNFVHQNYNRRMLAKRYLELMNEALSK